MKYYLINYFIVSFLIVLAIAISGCEDDPTAVQPPPPTINELHTNGTIIPTSPSQVHGTMFITDENGNTINGITSNNISASLSWNIPLEAPQDLFGIVNITQNSQTGQNVAGAVTMDYSGSMGSSQLDCMENGVITYIESMKSNDLTETIKFSSIVEVVQPFTSDTTLLTNSVTSYWSGTGGRTALYSSIYKGIQDVIQQADNLIKSVIAFTDGMENESSITREQLISHALSNGIPVYTVGLLWDTTSATSRDLENIADTTGAFYFWLQPDNCTDLTRIYSTISGQLAGSYDLTVDWQGTLPPSGTVVTATITTNYANFSSTFSRSYSLP